MARKPASRLQKRREVEAADAKAEASVKAPAAKKAAAKKRPSRRKAKVPDRKRKLWGVFSGTLKEEARFPYDQRKQAEDRLELLRSKSKKLYFIQPIKEVIGAETAAPVEDEELPADDVELDADADAETDADSEAEAEAEAEADEPEEMEEPADEDE